MITKQNQTNGQDFFEYTTNTTVDGGTGAYNGYSDLTTSTGRYVFTSPNTSTSQQSVHATYTWSYSSNQGETNSGSVDRTVTYSTLTRLYVSSQTDLNDYDSYNSSTLSIWFKIPTTIKQNDKISILDYSYSVTGIKIPYSFNGGYVYANELYGTGTGSRHDSYGIFTYTFENWYYFDPATGYIIAEKYIEHDTGSYLSEPSTFTLTEYVGITSSSYALQSDLEATILSILIPILGIMILIIAIIVVIKLYLKFRWGSRIIQSSKYGQVSLSRIKSLSEFSYENQETTLFFRPFLNDFVNKAFLSKDIIVQVKTGNILVGLGINNKEADLGTILTFQPEIKFAIQKYMHVHDFFTETRTKKDQVSLMQDPYNSQQQTSIPGISYNLIDAYQILNLKLDQNYYFDTNLIREMKEQDLASVIAISNEVNGIKSNDWIRGQINAGDIGLVAVMGPRIIGFAFASINENYGRLHSLTVLPQFRNQGIGKQLMKARLKILYELGITDVVTEIANWNLSSLQIAYSHGFIKMGELYIETDRTQPRVKKIMRI